MKKYLTSRDQEKNGRGKKQDRKEKKKNDEGSERPLLEACRPIKKWEAPTDMPDGRKRVSRYRKKWWGRGEYTGKNKTSGMARSVGDGRVQFLHPLDGSKETIL